MIGWSGPVLGSHWSGGGRGGISRGGGQRPSVEDDGGGWVQHNTEDARAGARGGAVMLETWTMAFPVIKAESGQAVSRHISSSDTSVMKI